MFLAVHVMTSFTPQDPRLNELHIKIERKNQFFSGPPRRRTQASYGYHQQQKNTGTMIPTLYLVPYTVTFILFHSAVHYIEKNIIM